jgi:hypothetical protein
MGGRVGRVPHANRVDPHGRLIATPARGLFFGNRGVLHDRHGQLSRERTSERRWLICVTEFKGRRRPLLRPGHYTELFFLDEAVGLAAGHRPCVECRRPAFLAFTAALGRPDLRAGELDRILDGERWQPGVLDEPATRLPDGTFVDDGEQAFLIRRGQLLPWTPSGYGAPERRPAATYRLLTPPTSLAALRGGYVAELHPSA